jgi:SAM-dependent methyltransferase
VKENGLPKGQITLLEGPPGGTGRLIVHDGNHRLVIADKLGLDVEASIFSCEYWLRQEWWMRNNKDPKYHLYQSIFLNREEIAIGQRRDALDRMDAVRREDIEGKSVLVLGCNNAHDCFMAGELGAARIVGVDINAEELNYAMRANTYYAMPIRLQQFDLKQPYDGGQFDTILAFSIYDKTNKPALLQTLQTAGGVIYFEGHSLHQPVLSDADYRERYKPILSHFGNVELVRETPDKVRRMYRVTQ